MRNIYDKDIILKTAIIDGDEPLIKQLIIFYQTLDQLKLSVEIFKNLYPQTECYNDAHSYSLMKNLINNTIEIYESFEKKEKPKDICLERSMTYFAALICSIADNESNFSVVVRDNKAYISISYLAILN